ncbi:MAG: hypothetical protein MMC33_007359 [Icmadophila ericetorum]|nr:hypothetical protein [Icmadophila ericetorum]
MNAAANGNDALEAGNFSEAIEQFTRAINLSPKAVDYFVKRSTAFTRLNPPNYIEAVSDAEQAVVLAHERGKRELIGKAQLRRGVAFFGLERFADANACFGWAKKMTPKESTLGIWELKVAGKLKGLDDDDERKVMKVQEMPEVQHEQPVEPVTHVESTTLVQSTNGAGHGDDKTTTSTVEAPKVEGVQTPASKIRYEWYQTNDTVVVTLFAKGVPKDKTTVTITPSTLECTFPLPSGSDYDLSLDPLCHTIDSDTSTYKIMSTKVEFFLKKSSPGQKWANIEGTGTDNTIITKTSDGSTQTISSPTVATITGPYYPTSSRTGPKNWDKLATDLVKKTKAQEAADKAALEGKNKDTKGKGKATDDGDPSYSPSKVPKDPEDFDDDFDDEADPVNGFFKKLYKSADPDTRRAMMKSYQESNGTALSTNWSEVGRGKVETTPPEGMVERKWGE